MANYNDDYNQFGQDNMQYSEFGSNDSMNYSYPGQGNSGAYSGSIYDSVDRTELATNTIAKSFMIMVIALVVTAVTAYITITNPSMFNTMLKNVMLFFIIEFAVVIGASYCIKKNNAIMAGILFTAYCIINGMTLSVIFLAYEIGSIQQIFVLAAVVFAIMAIYGFTTRRDLTSIGAIALMALIGMLVVTLFNVLIFHSTGVEMVMNYFGVIIFIGLTAYDVQKLKKHSLQATTGNANSLAVYFAMELYLDLLNLFLHLLAIMGKSRN